MDNIMHLLGDPSWFSKGLLVIVSFLGYYIKRTANNLYDKIQNSCSAKDMNEYVDHRIKEEIEKFHVEICLVKVKLESMTEILNVKLTSLDNKLNYLLDQKKV